MILIWIGLLETYSDFKGHLTTPPKKGHQSSKYPFKIYMYQVCRDMMVFVHFLLRNHHFCSSKWFSCRLSFFFCVFLFWVQRCIIFVSIWFSCRLSFFFVLFFLCFPLLSAAMYYFRFVTVLGWFQLKCQFQSITDQSVIWMLTLHTKDIGITVNLILSYYL